MKTLRYFPFIALLATCWGCQTHEKNDRLQAKVDSLELVVSQNKNLAATLNEVSAMIDSIGVSSKKIGKRIDAEEGSLKEISGRMREIAAYVHTSQEKISMLDKKLLAANSSSSWSVTIKTLETNLKNQNLELSRLQDRALQYANQNQNLIHVVELQKSEIDDKLMQLQSKQDELATLQDGVDRMLIASSDSRADNCYIRAQLLEEAANRTKLAPRKKRSTRLEAIELYKMASYYGKEEADQKIQELEKKI